MSFFLPPFLDSTGFVVFAVVVSCVVSLIFFLPRRRDITENQLPARRGPERRVDKTRDPKKSVSRI